MPSSLREDYGQSALPTGWLQLSYTEVLYAQHIQDLSFQQAEHYEQCLSKARARY